jgi:REP element-mobilizing transposase RayT
MSSWAILSEESIMLMNTVNSSSLIITSAMFAQCWVSNQLNFGHDIKYLHCWAENLEDNAFSFDFCRYNWKLRVKKYIELILY